MNYSNIYSNNSLHVAPGAETRAGTLSEDNCVSGEIIANFLDGGFLK